jgi:hypothetical protein
VFCRKEEREAWRQQPEVNYERRERNEKRQESFNMDIQDGQDHGKVAKIQQMRKEL